MKRKKSLNNVEVKQEPVEIKQEPMELLKETAKDRRTMVPANELKELAADPDSCLTRIRSRVHVALPPKCLSNLTKGLVTHFNKQINCFQSELDGILAGYGKLYLRSATGDLLNEETHIHLDVVSDFWVFKPIPGATLKGTVNETSHTHVSVIVHGCFNVSCYKPLDQEASLWHGSHAEMGDTVRLRILRADMSPKIPYLVGSLIADPARGQNGAKSKKSLKRKHDQVSSDAETQESEDKKDLLIKSITEKVKKKRKSK